MGPISISQSLEAVRHGNGATDAAGKREELREAAREFEALLLTELVKSVDILGADREGGISGPGTDVYRGLVETMLGDSLAKKGGIGLADALVQALQPGAAKPAPSDAGGDA